MLFLYQNALEDDDSLSFTTGTITTSGMSGYYEYDRNCSELNIRK